MSAAVLESHHLLCWVDIDGWSVGRDMADPDLTEEQIAAAMAKADRRVCLGSDRCFALPYRLADAREICTLKGRCKVGWVVSKDGRESFDV